MKIIDLDKNHEELYFCCLEDWSDEMKEAGSHKERWYGKMKPNGLRVKLAEDDNGSIGGMIQYAPIEYSHALGKDIYFIYCIWVHGHKKGRGNFQKRGLGTALLSAAEEDVHDLGGAAIAAWGVSLPFWMKASWFKKHGYEQVERTGIMSLLWKKFHEGAIPPQWITMKKKPEKVAGRVRVTAFSSGWCPAQNMTLERTKRAVAEIDDDRIQFELIDTFDRDNLREWGISDSIFVDGNEITKGPPLKYAKIKRKIQKALKKL